MKKTIIRVIIGLCLLGTAIYFAVSKSKTYVDVESLLLGEDW